MTWPEIRLTSPSTRGLAAYLTCVSECSSSMLHHDLETQARRRLALAHVVQSDRGQTEFHLIGGASVLSPLLEVDRPSAYSAQTRSIGQALRSWAAALY